MGMRRSSYAIPTQWIKNKGGDVVGIALGSDFCSEHEWGVKIMKQHFGISLADDLDGIERRIIRQLPKHLRFFEEKDWAGIFLSPLGEHYIQPPAIVKGELKYCKPYDSRSENRTLVAGWDESTFGIVTHTKSEDKERKRLQTIWDAFQKLDIAFWTNVGVFHMGGGLIFCIASKVPENDKLAMREKDIDEKRLAARVKEIGIEEELKKADRRYYALSPRWISEFKGMKSEFDVIFWLNPMQQHTYNAGWFTIEDLRAWKLNTGPVMRKAESSATSARR